MGGRPVNTSHNSHRTLQQAYGAPQTSTRFLLPSMSQLRRSLVGLLFVMPLVVTAQQSSVVVPVPSSDTAASRTGALPFAPGEQLEYAISYGPLHVGHGTMQLAAAPETVRGIPVYHATFHINGGTLFFRVDDVIESWFDTTTFTSLRFTQNIHEGRYHAHRDFEIFPSERRYLRVGDTSYATVEAPLDDASVLYFVRTLSLTVGAQYTFDRYFQLEGNPFVLKVLRAERVTVPAGTFDAIVVQPIIATRGIFSQRGRAEVWLRADGGHEVLQMKSHLAFGSINLHLTRVTRAAPADSASLPKR